MDKLKMKTENIADKNYEILSKMFPNALTEMITGYDDDGKPIVERAIDADVLRQEISCKVVEGKDERYQFTWPDKKKAVLFANTPIDKTLRPCREESVDFDNTENLYIEGDNLEVLKLLQETYLGKVKMIYIDPPYNTGNDFVYEDDFSQNMEKYRESSGQFDDNGNQLVTNTESNGRFHTDWLNMIYSRLRLSKNLLSEDGAIFMSIDDNEVDNLLKIGNEIFGESNYCGMIPYRKRTMKTDVPFGVSQDYEWVLVYAKSSQFFAGVPVERKYYSSSDYPYDRWRLSDLTTQKIESQRPNSAFNLVNPRNGDVFKYNPKRLWAITKDTFQDYYNRGKIVFPGDYGFLNISIPAYRVFESEDREKSMKLYGSKSPLKSFSTVLNESVGMNEQGSKEVDSLVGNKVFSFPKPTSLIYQFLLSMHDSDAIVLDFFAGSSTTAHAVMQINAEDNGNRKYIMVQLPQKCEEKSEAFRNGYKNICEIGKTRMKNAAKAIKDNNPDAVFDGGFRVLKCDSSNMKDIYYTPSETQQSLFDTYVDNIKEDRTPEDLLFQVMLDLGVLLSSKIEETTIAGKQVFNVEDGFLIACFDKDVTEETVKAVAEKKPYYAVFRDSSMANDSVATNFDQIFASISPETVRKVL